MIFITSGPAVIGKPTLQCCYTIEILSNFVCCVLNVLFFLCNVIFCGCCCSFATTKAFCSFFYFLSRVVVQGQLVESAVRFSDLYDLYEVFL